MSRSPGKPKSRPKHALPPEALDLVAARFRALSEPMRLRLLNALMSGERSVSQLVADTGASQANVSKHLSVLREAGLVGFRKDGPVSYYTVVDPLLGDLCELVCRGLREGLRAKSAQVGLG